MEKRLSGVHPGKPAVNPLFRGEESKLGLVGRYDGVELRSSGQGFFGDLAMRFRLFFNAGKVIEALNDAEAIDEALEAHRDGAITIDGRDVSRDLLIGAHVTAGAAVEKLRHLVFGTKLAPRGETDYLIVGDGPARRIDPRSFSADNPGPLVLIDDDRRD